MVQDMIKQVRVTQKRLRQQIIAQVLDEFDGHIMGLSPQKRRMKYDKMAESAFSFYRGSGYLFYFDVSREWFPYHSALDRPTWIQGDLHFENFGAFRSESGRTVFDVNDFDEGYIGSYLYDLLRMAVSIALVCRGQGLTHHAQKDAIEGYLSAYIEQMRRFAKLKEDPRFLVFDEDATDGPIRKMLKKLNKRESGHLLEGLTTLNGISRRFQWSDELKEPTEKERAALVAGWADYLGSLDPAVRRPDAWYSIKDIAVKHGSGTASIGLDRYYILIEGGGFSPEPEDLIIEIKEVRAPVPAYFMPYSERFWRQFAHQGKRVIMTQKAMHHEADPFLGFLTMEGRHFYARERSPFKKKLKLDSIEDMGDWLNVTDGMGRITAKMHARADTDEAHGMLAYHSEVEILRAVGEDTDSFADYITHWAIAYAHQAEEDYALFIGCLAEGDGTTPKRP